MKKKSRIIRPQRIKVEGDSLIITSEIIANNDKETIVKCINKFESDKKKEQRGRRCLNPDGTRCDEKNKCSLCKKIQKIDLNETCCGLPRSLDEMEISEDPMPSSHTFISPEEYAIKQELHQVICATISLLEPKDKEIILLFLEGKTEDEIASITGLKQRTVNNHKHKIFEELRNKLKDF